MRCLLVAILLSSMPYGCATSHEGPTDGSLPNPDADIDGGNASQDDGGPVDAGDAEDFGECRLADTSIGNGFQPVGEKPAVSQAGTGNTSEPLSVLWSVQTPCPEIFPGLNPVESSGAVGRIERLHPEHDVFVGTLYRRETWASALAGPVVAGVYAIDTLTGETLACSPLPDVPAGTGFRNSYRSIVYHSELQQFLISGEEGWLASLLGEADESCEDCIEHHDAVLWSFDGSSVQEVYRDSIVGGSTGRAIPLSNDQTAFLYDHGKVSTISSSGALVRKEDFRDAIDGCGPNLRLLNVVPALGGVFLHFSASGSGVTENYFLELGQAEMLSETFPQVALDLAVPVLLTSTPNGATLVDGAEVQTTTCRSVDVVTSDDAFACRSVTLNGASYFGIEIVRVTGTVDTIELDAGDVPYVSAAAEEIVVILQSLSERFLEVRSLVSGETRQIALPYINYAVQPFVLKGLVVVQGTGELVGIRSPGTRPTASSFPRGVLNGGNGNAGPVSTEEM